MMTMIMTTEIIPWDEIQVPTADFNVRLVESSNDIPIYWGRNIGGNCLLVVELEGDHRRQFQNVKINVRGVSTDLQAGLSEGKQNLVLTLEQHINRDLFLGLCKSLIASLVNVKDSNTAVSVIFHHLGRWKNFLAGKNPRILTPEQIRGLFGELHFLQMLCQRRMTEENAIDAWYGPDGTHHDFVFGNISVEVKTLSGTDRNTVRISSEDQLESVVDHLFLRIYRFGNLPDSPHSKSLNEFIRMIENQLTAPIAVEKLSLKLAAFGYVELPDYDSPRLLIVDQQVYRVVDEFPKIVRSELDAGLTRVKYELMLEHIEKFKCDESEIWLEN